MSRLVDSHADWMPEAAGKALKIPFSEAMCNTLRNKWWPTLIASDIDLQAVAMFMNGFRDRRSARDGMAR